jgi:hypothetical protein
MTSHKKELMELAKLQLQLAKVRRELDQLHRANNFRRRQCQKRFNSKGQIDHHLKTYHPYDTYGVPTNQLQSLRRSDS